MEEAAGWSAQRPPLLFVLVYIRFLVTAQTVLLSAAQRAEGNVNVPVSKTFEKLKGKSLNKH